jgi:hypothetical protein
VPDGGPVLIARQVRPAGERCGSRGDPRCGGSHAARRSGGLAREWLPASARDRQLDVRWSDLAPSLGARGPTPSSRLPATTRLASGQTIGRISSPDRRQPWPEASAFRRIVRLPHSNPCKRTTPEGRPDRTRTIDAAGRPPAGRRLSRGALEKRVMSFRLRARRPGCRSSGYTLQRVAPRSRGLIPPYRLPVRK